MNCINGNCDQILEGSETTCPHCGAPVPKPVNVGRVVLFCVGFAIAVIVAIGNHEYEANRPKMTHDDAKMQGQWCLANEIYTVDECATAWVKAEHGQRH